MGRLSVEVVYALPQAEDAVIVRLPAGATVRDALAASGLAARHPAFNLGPVGIFGKVVSLDARVADGDRVEVYRSLSLDPKEARRKRAKRKSRRARKT